MSDKEKEYWEKLQRVNQKMRGLKYMFRGIFGMSEVPMREQIRETVKELKPLRQRQPQQSENIQQSPSEPPPVTIQERFMSRPFLGLLQQSQEPQQPPMDAITQQAISEKEAQLIEQAEKRAKEEAEQKARDEKAEALRKAKENLGIHSA